MRHATADFEIIWRRPTWPFWVQFGAYSLVGALGLIGCIFWSLDGSAGRWFAVAAYAVAVARGLRWIMQTRSPSGEILFIVRAVDGQLWWGATGTENRVLIEGINEARTIDGAGDSLRTDLVMKNGTVLVINGQFGLHYDLEEALHRYLRARATKTTRQVGPVDKCD